MQMPREVTEVLGGISGRVELEQLLEVPSGPTEAMGAMGVETGLVMPAESMLTRTGTVVSMVERTVLPVEEVEVVRVVEVPGLLAMSEQTEPTEQTVETVEMVPTQEHRVCEVFLE
jgi:hypothetical protein